MHNDNNWSIDIINRIIKAEKASYALNNYLKSKHFIKKNKVRFYTTIIKPTLIYGCEICKAVFNRSKKDDCS